MRPDSQLFPSRRYLHDYHKYWSFRPLGIKNQAFDETSRRILDVKAEKGAKHIAACREFADQIVMVIQQYRIEPSETIVVPVPSSTEGVIADGLRRICQSVADSIEATDGIGVLRRARSIQKLTSGGDRSQQVHLESIVVDYDVVGKKIVLIDDVATSWNTIMACEQLLLEMGATAVASIAIGQTVNE